MGINTKKISTYSTKSRVLAHSDYTFMITGIIGTRKKLHKTHRIANIADRYLSEESNFSVCSASSTTTVGYVSFYHDQFLSLSMRYENVAIERKYLLNTHMREYSKKEL